MELQRRNGMKDGFLWFCEKCNQKIYEEYLDLTDIVKEPDCHESVLWKYYSCVHKKLEPLWNPCQN